MYGKPPSWVPSMTPAVRPFSRTTSGARTASALIGPSSRHGVRGGLDLVLDHGHLHGGVAVEVGGHLLVVHRGGGLHVEVLHPAHAHPAAGLPGVLPEDVHELERAGLHALGADRPAV